MKFTHNDCINKVKNTSAREREREREREMHLLTDFNNPLWIKERLREQKLTY